MKLWLKEESHYYFCRNAIFSVDLLLSGVRLIHGYITFARFRKNLAFMLCFNLSVGAFGTHTSFFLASI